MCGSDLVTYPNACAMRGAACRQKKAIIAVYNGRCQPEREFLSYIHNKISFARKTLSYSTDTFLTFHYFSTDTL